MIWHLIDSSSVGGAERHIATVAGSLMRDAHAVRVMLYQRHGDNPWLRQLDAEGIPYSVLDGTFGGLVLALRSEQPSLVHTHGYKSGILGRLAAMLTRIPVVTTFHSGQRGPWPVGAYDFVDDWSSFSAHRIAVSSEIQSRLPLSTTVIPSYVVTPTVCPDLALPRKIGFVGRLSEEKGPQHFCMLARRFGDLGSWHVYGDGAMRGALEAEFGDVVTFHGVQTNMDRVWPQLGLLVMPSRFEGVPLAALEAAAAGVPVLASRVGGLPTVIVEGATGWMFPYGDLESAGQCLSMWSAQVEHGAMDLRAACWTRAREHFSETRWFPEILKVYEVALGRALR
ncbi:MAG: glycosyltransferase family 4 protein [Hyphomicrobiaceae bacterium]|nr:glycosyltransferase family 4 protein [Hyphomicrobiaceae bacterium]